MKTIITLITILFLATSSFAAEIREADVKAFLDSWLSVQNTGSYSNYAAMYADTFAGIRRTGSSTHNLNRDAWLKDRKKMFKKKMVVEANNPEIKLAGTTATVKFEQIWASDTYKDKGDKLLDLTFENGKLKIIREEMLFSKVNTEANTKQSKVTTYNSTGDANVIPTTSKYTSIQKKDCSEVVQDILMNFMNAESAFNCPAPKGWRLFKVYERDEERSWLNIGKSRAVWTTIEQVVTDDPRYKIGYFPNIDSAQNVEWRMQNNVPVALIFRVAATDPNPSPGKLATSISCLHILSLKGNEPRFCGIAKTNEEAREIADKSANCSDKLLKEF